MHDASRESALQAHRYPADRLKLIWKRGLLSLYCPEAFGGRRLSYLGVFDTRPSFSLQRRLYVPQVKSKFRQNQLHLLCLDIGRLTLCNLADAQVRLRGLGTRVRLLEN